MKAYKVVSLTHKELSLNNLGKYLIKDEPSDGTNALSDRLHHLKDNFQMDELCYLSTCNRVAYIFCADVEIDETFLHRLFQFINPHLSEGELFASAKLAKVYEGPDAIRHLHEVAASLDSLVIGEREILRQLRLAYENSCKMGLTGDNLRLAFKFIIPAAKKIYTETQIGEKPVSIVSLAARKLRAFLGENTDLSPSNARFALIGAGETNQLMGKFLKGDGVRNATVFNRGAANGEKLAGSLEGSYKSLDEMARYNAGFDVLITCTGSTSHMVDADLLRQMAGASDAGAMDTGAMDAGMKAAAPKLIIDLAIPQDISPEAINLAQANNWSYVGIEALREIAEQNLAFRRSELDKAHALLDGCVEEFLAAFNRRQLEKAFSTLPGQVRAIRERAVTQVFSKELEQMDAESRETLHKVMDYLENKYIGLPIATARAAMTEKNRA